MTLPRYARLLLAMASGAALALSFPNYNLPLLAWPAVGMLLLACFEAAALGSAALRILARRRLLPAIGAVDRYRHAPVRQRRSVAFRGHSWLAQRGVRDFSRGLRVGRRVRLAKNAARPEQALRLRSRAVPVGRHRSGEDVSDSRRLPLESHGLCRHAKALRSCNWRPSPASTA